MRMSKIVSGVLLLLLVAVFISGCGVPQSELDAVIAEKDALQEELDDIKAVYPLSGFESLSEFKNWLSDHVQPETTYISDAFLAACKVQAEGMADGYLIGIDVDTLEEGEEYAVYVSAFVGNTLYWWFVEDVEAYGSYELMK